MEFLTGTWNMEYNLMMDGHEAMLYTAGLKTSIELPELRGRER